MRILLKYLILVVQNMLTTAILTSLTLAFVQKESGEGRRRLGAAFGAGAAAALVIAVLRRTTRYINREYWNTGTLAFSIFVGIFFLLLIWSVLFRKRGAFRAQARDAAAAVLVGLQAFYALPDLFLYPTEFVLAGESMISTDFLFSFIGYLAGVLLVLLSALALHRVGQTLSARLLRALLTAALAIHMANQLSSILQFLLARRIIPMMRWLFNLLRPVINHNVYFLYALMLLSVLLPLLTWLQNRGPGEGGQNPAERRKLRAARRRRRRWSAVAASGYVLAVLTMTMGKAYSEREVVLSPAEPMTIANGEILIPLEQVGDWHLHRFAHIASDGTEVRFIVVQKNEAAFGVGLDACDICGATGYYERDDEVVCKLCDVVMNRQTIGFKGGCNPVPLAYAVRGGQMVIQIEDLENEKSRFGSRAS